jgi:hypothetical protein
MRLFIRRLIGATMLDVDTYEEVEADASATPQALGVVLLSALAAGIGSRGLGASQPPALALIAVVALLGWAAWALLTFEIGARLFPEPQTQVDVGQLLRTIGFASAPGILRVFGALPAVAIPVFALTAIWMLVAMIVAVRQALDYTSTTRAVAVCGVGWALTLVVILVLGLIVSPPAS